MTVLDKNEWKKFLLEFDSPHILQTSYWGELKSHFGWYPVRVGNDAGAQILFRKLPINFTLAYIPKGPIGESWKKYMPQIDELCRKHKAVFLKIEMDAWEDDAKDLGINDGDKVRVHTRRGSLEAKAQVGGTKSLVKPARNNVPRGYMFGPWNLSVADSADPKKNKWLANGVTSRIWDPVSGQVDFKKSAARIEKI